MLHRLAVVAVAALMLLPAASARAGIWTPIPSGTVQDITAIDATPGTTVYGTANGQILKDGVLRASFPGVTINDIALNPSGTRGVAVGPGGKLYVSADGGLTWALKSLTNTTWALPSGCSSSPGAAVGRATPTGSLTAVAWASDTVAYVTSVEDGVVLKTTNGAATFDDASRHADRTCFLDPYDTITDVDALPGSDLVWFVEDFFGTAYTTSNGLTSTALKLGDGGVNCYDHAPRIALDHDNPNRAFMVDRCSGNLSFGFTQDAGNHWDMGLDYQAGQGSSLSGLNGVSVAGGSALAVGNAGAILVSPDGANAYFQRADGTDATNDWLSVDKADASHAVVGGRGGRLLTSASANAIPDVVAPAGTVSGPTSVTAGVPVTYTANVSDNAGGSGVDAGSFAWSASGLPGASGNPVTVTFPSAGFYTLNVGFKDAAGNAASASIGVSVKAAAAATVPPPTTTTPAPSVKRTSSSVPGATVTLGTPRACVAPGATFTVTLTWKKQKRKGNRFVKVRRADFYLGSKRVKIDKKAPFTQTLKVKAGTKPGSSVTVKARAFIKVTKGKSPTKSIRSSVKVC
jgi:hypothetical protein